MQNALTVEERCRAAKIAGRRLAAASGQRRSELLVAAAEALAMPSHREVILAANRQDARAAEAAFERGELTRALVDRLALTASKLDGLCEGLRQLAAMPDIIGNTLERRQLDDGLVLERTSCPLGVLGVVFEARPDALVQISGLALRTGNAVVLKGGTEALRTNMALTEVLHQVLEQQGFDPALVVMLEDRQDVLGLIAQKRYVDLVVARGSTSFVEFVQANASVPVLGHAEGLCHLYLHRSADVAMAARIAVDAKCSYPAACNAIETLLWEPGAEPALAATIVALHNAGVELVGCEATRALHEGIGIATHDDWSTEYGDLKLSIRRVENIEAALEHIESYGSGHTECIVTSDAAAVDTFVAAVDAAGVFHNASTRFADGFRYGLGAEVGISTSKLHARGPVGVDGLVTYRWLLRGTGQVSRDYGPGARAFQHLDLPLGKTRT